jgi:hypothetical protein
MRLTTQRSRLLVLALTSAACSSGDDGASDSQGSASSTSTTDASTGSTSEASTSAGTSSGGASDAGTSGSSEASTSSSSAGTTSDAATSDTTTSDTTTSDTTTSDTTAGTTGAIEDCDALLAAFWAEVAEIRGCEEDKQCGQVLTGTSCGCTRNWIARLDADTSHFLALVDLAGELRCELPFISTCDCPEADGYRCDAGTCSWNYL